MDRKILSVIDWKRVAWELIKMLVIVPAAFITAWHVVLGPWGIKDLQLLQGFVLAVLLQLFHLRYIE